MKKIDHKVIEKVNSCLLPFKQNGLFSQDEINDIVSKLSSSSAPSDTIPMQQDRWLTTNQVVEYTNKSRPTIWRAVKNGKLKSNKHSSRQQDPRNYKMSWVDNWMFNGATTNEKAS
jgi:predicted DNA-binding transcriptional regulator AlpA